MATIQHKAMKDSNSHVLGWIKSSAPTTTLVGVAWINTSDSNRLNIWNGSSFDSYAKVADLSIYDYMRYKGATNCSANPNYPAADAGDVYRVSVAGKIGGASGTVVQVSDMFICTTDGTVTGTQAAVGAYWNVIQANIDGAVIGPASATDGNLAVFDQTTGKLIKDGGTPFRNVVEDTTPQLGGSLDAQEYDIDNVGDIIHDDATASDWTLQNIDQDKDIIFSGNDGGAQKTIMALDVSEGQLSGLLKATSGVLGPAVSATDIKTVNSNSLVGSGDVSVGTMSNVVEDTTPQLGAALDAQEYDIDNVGDIIHDDATASDWTLENQDTDKDIIFKGNDGGVPTEIMKLDVSEGQLSGLLKATSGVIGPAVSATDIKTVNSTSLIGSGDVAVGTMSNIVEDTTPQLGAALDAQEYDIDNVGDLIHDDATASDWTLQNLDQDKDIIFSGNDGGDQKTIMALDVSEGQLSGLLKATSGVLGPAVSATDIKTVNSTSLIGSGDVAVGTMSNIVEDTTPQLGATLDAQEYDIDNIGDLIHDDATASDWTFENQDTDKDIILKGNDGGVPTEILKLDVSEGQLSGLLKATSGVLGPAVSATDIKTVNSASLIGSGDVAVGTMSNVVEDTTPQLGGSLDAQENDLDNVGDIIHDDATASDWTLQNLDQDKDIIFSGNDGGAQQTIMALDVSEGQLSGLLKATSGVLGPAVSATDIKTVNSTSLIGSGDIAIPVGDVVGPGSSVAGKPAVFDGATGKLLKDSGGNIVYVGISDDINAAITAATAGDTLILASGTYTITASIVIDKALNIIGQGIGKTTITSTTNDIALLNATADGVRIANLSVVSSGTTSGTMTGIRFSGIAESVIASGRVLNCEITMSGSVAQRGIVFNDASGLVISCIISVTSTAERAHAVYMIAAATAEANTLLDVYETKATVNGNANGAYTYYCLDNGTAATVTMNLYRCYGQARKSNGTSARAVFVSGDGATGNVYSGLFDGTDYDLAQATSGTFNSYAPILVTGLILGTVSHLGKLNAAYSAADGTAGAGATTGGMTFKNGLYTTGNATGINNVVEDTTPQLGGSLDAQENDIDNVGDIIHDDATASDWTLQNIDQDKDIIFSGNDGGAQKTIMALDVSEGALSGLIKASAGVLGPAVSATDIKTVNSTSLIGSGDVAIPVGDVVGPASVTDGVYALFDTTTGKLLKAGTAPLTLPTVTGNMPGMNRTFGVTVVDPATTYGVSTIIPICTETPAALHITKIWFRCDANPTTEVTGDIKYADDLIGLGTPTVIQAIDTADGAYTSGALDVAVAADKCIYLSYDTTPDVATNIHSILVQYDFD